MKKLLFISFVILTMSAFAQVDGLPQNPDPGKCYVKCTTPDEFGTQSVKVETSPAYKVLKVVAPKYKWVTEKVMVQEASKKYIYHPATYKTIKVPYVKKEAGKTYKVIPASFVSDSQEVETFPKTAQWEYSTYKDCASGNPDDCKTLCYVEKPAQYRNIPVKKLAQDAHTEEVPISEKGDFYYKKVIDQPARVEEIEIPAKYTTIKRQVIDVPAKVIEENVPAQYVDVATQVLVKKGGVSVWKEIDCGLVKPNKLNILWPLNSAKLTSKAKSEVDRVLIPLLRDNAGASIELASHTDSRGSKEYNKRLSQMRADAIKSYLISKGINPSRIVSIGYGEGRLLNNCSDGVKCSEAQHQVNRRTEYRIINSK